MKRSQIFAIIGAVVLLVLLFVFSGRKVNVKTTEVAEVHATENEFLEHVKKVKAELDSSSLHFVMRVEKSYQEAIASEKSNYLDSLVKVWEALRQPMVAAYYSEEKLTQGTSFSSLLDVANRYFYATRSVDDHLRGHLFTKAIDYYQKALLLEPLNSDARINLGVSYLENSDQPMKGVGLLKEVLAEEPQNKKALLNLGYFSIKSGQYDIAIERFKSLIELDPEFGDAYMYLGDAYESKGEINKAIEAYTFYTKFVENPEILDEVHAYINKLKSKL